MSYTQRVARETPTRLWINNPTGDDLLHALEAGAVSGTTNPSYCSRLIQREAGYIRAIIDQVIVAADGDEEAADLVYQRVSARFMQAFLPVYRESSGRLGFVTMQDNPGKDDDPDSIVAAAMRHRSVGVNYMAKVPVIQSGMEAMRSLVERNVPICATECFTVSQARAACELYEGISRKCGNSPPFFITHITGILDEEIQDYAKRTKVSLPPELVEQAGCIVGREIYRMIKSRSYRTTLLGGGARHARHFTEFVGGDVHITLNWDTIRELNESDGPVAKLIDKETPQQVVSELSRGLPDFQQAYHEGTLRPEEFKDIPSLQRFRNSFLRGWADLLKEIAARRRSLA